MCRNIQPLYNFDPPASPDELRLAALQYVRKVSGYRQPSQANRAAFEAAVQAVADATAELLAGLTTSAAPRNRQAQAARRKARSAARFSTG